MIAYAIAAKAQAHLEEIDAYVSERNLDAADALTDTFTTAFEGLGAMAHKGHAKPDWTAAPVLFLRVKRYWVIYDPETIPLTILAVYHQSRDVKTLLAQP